MQVAPALVPLPVAPEASTGPHKRADSARSGDDAQSSRSFTDIRTKALVVTKPKADFELQDVILDEVRPDEVLIEMKYSGICHTDIVLQQGLLPMVDFPAIFGHEGAGIVRAIGTAVKNKNLRVGDAALLSFNTCGDCEPCNTGHPAYCETHAEVNQNAVRISDRSTPARLETGESVRSQYFGQSSFSKMSVVNEKCVVACPSLDNLHIYAPIGCGFQTGAGTVLNVLKPEKDQSIVIFGMGSVGLAALMAAKSMEVGTIIAVDLVEQRLELAKDLGATHTLSPKTTSDVVAEIKRLTRDGADFALECTGVLSVLEDSIECLGSLGTAASIGVPKAGVKIQIDPLSFLLKNKRYMGVIEGDSNPVQFIPKLISMHQAGQFPIEKLCKVYPVSKMRDAVHDMHAGTVIKPVISWQ